MPPPHEIGPLTRHLERDEATERDPGDPHPRETEMLDQADRVVGHHLDRVRASGATRRCHTTVVEGDHLVTLFDGLVDHAEETPGIGALAGAAHEDDRFTLPVDLIGDFDPVHDRHRHGGHPLVADSLRRRGRADKPGAVSAGGGRGRS